MSGCNSDPTAGCDNSAIVAAIGECCTTQSQIMSEQLQTLKDIKTANAACCTLINTKLDTIIGLLNTPPCP